MRGKAAQRVLVTWLNVAAGALDLHDVLPDGATLLQTLYSAEDSLADPATTHHELIEIRDTMNSVNDRSCP